MNVQTSQVLAETVTFYDITYYVINVLSLFKPGDKEAGNGTLGNHLESWLIR